MAVVAGIDEAGLGPVLGPLVVSATAFRLPDEAAGESMWRLLAGATCRRPVRRRVRLAVGDSKKLYRRRRAGALEHLERAVLAMLAVRGRRPASLGRLLAIISPGAGDSLAQYPWYACGDLRLPSCISKTDAGLAANSLAAGLAGAGIELTTMRAEPVFAGEFNRIISATRNKSTLLFDVTARLLTYLWRRHSRERLYIHVDRHGGRIRYLSLLQRIFPGCRFKILDESDAGSVYRISDNGRGADVSFSSAAEDRHFPVALASMLSKYVRELCMELFNRYWVQQVPGLAPTAGYYTDGRRFYAQIAPAVTELGVDRGLLYRCR